MLLLHLGDRHRGWRPVGTLPELGHRPHELLWAESVETLTWAEMGSLLLAREQHYHSLLGAKVSQERSAPDLNNFDVGRAGYGMCLDDGVWLAWK